MCIRDSNDTWEYIKATRDRERPYDDVFVCAKFIYTSDNYIYGINSKGDTIRIKGLYFSLRHKVGTCEKKEDEDKNIDGTQWELTVYGLGHIFKYKSSDCYRIDPPSHYFYDTELNEFNNDLLAIKNWLIKTLDFIHITPKNFEKVKMRFINKLGEDYNFNYSLGINV